MRNLPRRPRAWRARWQGYSAYQARSGRAEFVGDDESSETAQLLDQEAASDTRSPYHCDGRVHCSQMTSCEEAEYFLANCPGVKMDGAAIACPARSSGAATGEVNCAGPTLECRVLSLGLPSKRRRRERFDIRRSYADGQASSLIQPTDLERGQSRPLPLLGLDLGSALNAGVRSSAAFSNRVQEEARQAHDKNEKQKRLRPGGLPLQIFAGYRGSSACTMPFVITLGSKPGTRKSTSGPTGSVILRAGRIH